MMDSVPFHRELHSDLLSSKQDIHPNLGKPIEDDLRDILTIVNVISQSFQILALTNALANMINRIIDTHVRKNSSFHIYVGQKIMVTKKNFPAVTSYPV